MTHDELIELLAQPAHTMDAHQARNVYLLALQAVAELHKPNENNQCPECEYYWIDEIKFCDYPCPTIEAIKKKLCGETR
jgi:hypothetical protein